jgi:hypothetical protein
MKTPSLATLKDPEKALTASKISNAMLPIAKITGNIDRRAFNLSA